MVSPVRRSPPHNYAIREAGAVEPAPLKRGQPLNKGQVDSTFVTSEKRTTSLQGPIVPCREAPLYTHMTISLSSLQVFAHYRPRLALDYKC